MNLKLSENELAKISLKFVMKLRENRRPKEVIDPSRGVPVHTLRWLSNQFSVTSSVIYLFQSTGRYAIKKRIVGNKNNWGTLEDELIISEKNRIIFDLHYIGKSQKMRNVPFGYLGFFRENDFTDLEVSSLKNIMVFLSDYMYEIIIINRKQFYNRALERITEIGQRDILPGTLIKLFQGKIHRAIRAYASYFLIINKDNLTIEYYQKPKWNKPRFVDKHPLYKLSKTFYKLCEENDFFHWIDLKPDNSLYDILCNYVEFEKDDWEYLIGVTKNDSTPIALWIFQFDKHQLLINDIVKELFESSNIIAQQKIKYLYQRRTKNMIVKPIFKSRDTRIDNVKVFILMPFTEQWSDRIWNKLIKPIVISEDLEPVRADDLYGRDIMEDIWSGIVQSRFVIADITNRNPNVFYELGIAHSIGKEVILLTQDSKDIPFDLNRYRHIIYQDNYDGYEILKNKLKSTIRDIVRK